VALQTTYRQGGLWGAANGDKPSDGVVCFCGSNLVIPVSCLSGERLLVTVDKHRHGRFWHQPPPSRTVCFTNFGRIVVNFALILHKEDNPQNVHFTREAKDIFKKLSSLLQMYVVFELSE
jgi:hypothetical protein